MHAMEWGDLKIFLTAVRAGSYTLAGAQLGINRTTVGRRIDALELAVGRELFRETPHGHAPTAEGLELLRAAEAMERQIEAVHGAMVRPAPPAARLRIASSAGMAVEFMQEFRAFQEIHPEMPIELLGELDPVDAVTHRRADLGIAVLRVRPLRLDGVKIATLSQAPYIARDHVKAAPLGWGHEIENALPGQWTVTNAAADPADIAGQSLFNNWPMLKQAVLCGFGSAFLWCFSAEAEPGLQRIACPDPRDDYPLWLLYRARTPPGRSLRALLAFLAERLPARLGTPPDSDTPVGEV